MKQLKLIILLVVCAMLYNCTSERIDFDEDGNVFEVHILGEKSLAYRHNLFLGFQDASGNDLVKGDVSSGLLQFIENNKNTYNPKPDLYTLEIIFPDELDYFLKLDYNNPNIILDESYPLLGLNMWYDPDCYYLLFMCASPNEFFSELPFVEKITFRLTFHDLFGDDSAHDIVTWWEKPNFELYGNNALCYRIEFEGKEYKIHPDAFGVLSATTLILEDK